MEKGRHRGHQRKSCGGRWRIVGGRNTLVPSSGRDAAIHVNQPIRKILAFAEREEIGLLLAQGFGVRAIARRLERSPSTISREVTRNAATRGGRLEYRASVAQWKAELVAKRPRPAKLVTNLRLHRYVQEHLEGRVHNATGRVITGPHQAPFNGQNKPHRGDRKWVNGWSPEQIAHRLWIDFPDYESMRISHEAIYQALYIQGRDALKRELVHCLRTGRALRVPRARAQAKAWAHVSEEVMVSNRPAEVEDRAAPGHWEGDLIIGLNRSAIATLVERSTRFTMLVYLPREEGYGIVPRTKNGPALAGYGTVTMTNALKKTVTNLLTDTTSSASCPKRCPTSGPSHAALCSWVTSSHCTAALRALLVRSVVNEHFLHLQQRLTTAAQFNPCKGAGRHPRPESANHFLESHRIAVQQPFQRRIDDGELVCPAGGEERVQGVRRHFRRPVRDKAGAVRFIIDRRPVTLSVIALLGSYPIIPALTSSRCSRTSKDAALASRSNSALTMRRCCCM